MRKLIKLEKKLNILFDNDIYEYLNPDYVYLPIYDGFELLKKQDDKVLINEIVVENKLNKIKSPISGVIKGTTFLNIYNKKTKCVVIENTYEEKINNKNVTLTRANIISTLSENNYLSFAKILENKNIKNLIINGMEDEPYIQNNPFILKKYANKLLKLIDDFVNIFQIDNAFISIKSNDTDNINLFLSKIGTYPKINLSLINDYYLLAQDYFLLENMNLSNEDSLVISASDLYKIYKLLNDELSYTTFVSIVSPFLPKSFVVNVKNGSLIKDVLKKLNIKKFDNALYICNGLMTGYEIDLDKEVITENTKGLIITNKDTFKEEKCNLCGMCYKICPVKVNPKKVMDTGIKSKSCIDCGLCSYICPCKINLRKYLRSEK